MININFDVPDLLMGSFLVVYGIDDFCMTLDYEYYS